MTKKIYNFQIEKLIREPEKKTWWDYRVVRKSLPNNEEIYYIAEVYYEGKKIVSFAGYFDEEMFDTYTTMEEVFGEVKHMSPTGYSKEELKGDLEKMLEAFKKPVIDYDDLISI